MQGAVFNANYSFNVITIDNNNIEIAANSLSFENNGASVATISFDGTSRPIKPNQIVSFSHEFDTAIETTIKVSFVGGAGSLIITEEKLTLRK